MTLADQKSVFTTTIRHTDDVQEQQGNSDRPPPEALDERRRRWAYLLRNQHYEPVIFDILSDELPKFTNSRVVDSTDIVTHMRECALILASAPDIFFAAVEGNLVSRINQDADLQAEYTAIHQRTRHQPSIYTHLLADDEGNAPTPNQYTIIRDMVQDYLNEGASGHAYRIDNITPPLVSLEASTSGYRKYLLTQNANRSPKRAATLERFCAGVTLRCSLIPPHLQGTPLPYPPAEVGYTLNAHRRLAQHRTHRSSNYVMNLVEDICTYFFHTNVLTQHFTMHQFIVHLIFRPSQAAIAEIFCSGLLQCWIEDGGGFNAYPAGRSVASSRRVSSEEWAAHGAMARLMSPLEERMETMAGRAEVWRKAVTWESNERDQKSDSMEEDKDEDEIKGKGKVRVGLIAYS